MALREFTLALPKGYRCREVLDFYARDPESVSERVSANTLIKCALIDGLPVVLEIDFTEDTALCASDAEDLAAAKRVVTRMLGIETDAEEFEKRFIDDPLLGPLIARQRGLRIPLTPDPWEALAWAIMGQQISLKVAVMLRRNLIAAKGSRHDSGLRAHPSSAVVATMNVAGLRELKFSGSKAEYLVAAARAIESGALPVHEMHAMPVERAASLASAVRGIGPWTVQYFFLRGLGLLDCLPAGDAGLAQGLGRITGTRPSEKQIREMMGRFAPWRSLATYHVWVSLKG